MGSEEDKQGKEFDKAFADMASLRVTRAELSGLHDGELALWQAEQKPGSAEFILADHEWRSRLVKRQNRAIYWAAVIGAVAVFVGVVLGWYLSSVAVKSAAPVATRSSQICPVWGAKRRSNWKGSPVT